MSTWWSQRRGAPQDHGWVGAHSGPHTALAAYAQAGTVADARPRIQFSPLFEGPDAASRLRGWTKSAAPGSATAIVLRSSDYRIVPTEAPPVPAEERAQALRWQIKDMLDFPADQCALDCLEVPGAVTGQASNRVFVVATPQATVRELMLSYRDGGVRLGAVDIAETALRNLAVLAGGDEAMAFLHIGLRSSRLAMVWQRELCAFRQFDLSTRELADALPMDRSMLLERIALEVQRTADAFVRQFQSAHLSSLWLCAAEQGEQLEQELSDLLALRVRHFRATEHLALPEGATLTDAPKGTDYTLVVGAALRGCMS
jgi:MSHA biogenesis protein MshI